MLRRGDEIELRIDDAAFEGKTVARHEGFVVFVEGGVPGDQVIARIVKAKKNFAEARIVRILSPSRERVEPRCRHFGVCGGCKWQHVDYAAQLRFKEQHVADAFKRIGGFSGFQLLPIIGSDAPYYYRNKMEFSFSNRQWLATRPNQVDETEFEEDVYLGLHVPQRYDKVLDLQECHLPLLPHGMESPPLSDQSDVTPLALQVLKVTREFARDRKLDVYRSESHSGYLRFLVVRQSVRRGEAMVNLVTFEDRPYVMQAYTNALLQEISQITTVVNTINDKRAQIAYGDIEKVYAGEGVIYEELGGLTFRISASSFFQTNTLQAEKLYGVAKDVAGLKGSEMVWDLYSGIGSIALFIADAAQQVVGIESVESAVLDARRNAELNRVENCSFILGDLKDRLTNDTDWMKSHPPPDLLLIDPPRSGMHPKVVQEILDLAPPRIVYVSCNPSTQARDVKLLCDVKYHLLKLQPVDMFPHTYHVENVASLQLVP
jgi:23S rRNA (uracil1939-C5)-methyltransferase